MTVADLQKDAQFGDLRYNVVSRKALEPEFRTLVVF